MKSTIQPTGLEEVYETPALADGHEHLREDSEEDKRKEQGSVVGALISHAVSGGVDVIGGMPNLSQPLTGAALVIPYTERAIKLAPPQKITCFLPIVMLTEHTTQEELVRCKSEGINDGKIYPYFRTTKSEHGIKQWGKMLQVVRWCGELGIRVHGHFEHPLSTFQNRDAEFVCVPVVMIFIEETDAIIVWEHGSDARCIPFWRKMAETGRFFVTLTAHHLATSEDRVYGDVRATCKPTIKTEADRQALVALVGENLPWVIMASDTAAHDVTAKHVHAGQCACGDFTAPFIILLCAHALTHLFATPEGRRTFANFTSENPRRLYKLPRASRTVRLARREFIIPISYSVGPWTVEPFWAGQALLWNFAN